MADYIRVIIPLIIGAFISLTLKEFGLDVVGPIVLSIIIGMLLSLVIKFDQEDKKRILKVAKILILSGIPIYILKNFYGLAQTIKISEGYNILFSYGAMLCYFVVTLVLGQVLNLPFKKRMLLAVGLSICGASAIIICADAIDSEESDISMSIIAVTLIGLFLAYVLLPLVGVSFNLTPTHYGIMTGALVPLSDLIAPSLMQMSLLFEKSGSGMITVAMATKVSKYFILILLVPALSYFVGKRELTLKFIIFTSLPFILTTILSYGEITLFKSTLPFWGQTYNFLWAMGVVAIGLTTDIRSLLSYSAYQMFLITVFASSIVTIILGLIIFSGWVV